MTASLVTPRITCMHEMSIGIFKKVMDALDRFGFDVSICSVKVAHWKKGMHIFSRVGPGRRG
jgi:uncharacterized UPF0146 family protein